MALTTYAGLKASIADWLNRSDLTNQIDDLMSRVPIREASDIQDSDEVSSDLGTGRGDIKSSKPSPDEKQDSKGSTGEFA